MNYTRLAEILFPGVEKTAEEYEAMFPARDLKEGAKSYKTWTKPYRIYSFRKLIRCIRRRKISTPVRWRILFKN